MTLTIELEPEWEQQLEIEAARAGLSKEEWAREFLKNNLRHTTQNFAPQVEQQKDRDRKSDEIERKLRAIREFEERAHEYTKDAPLLSDADVSRASIYEGRGL